MIRKLYEVKTSGVKRITALHHVFAESSTEAIHLVFMGQGERARRTEERWIEKPNHSARLVRPIQEED